MEIPKMKVFVYALTFLGYAWSGYGAGIISNLRDAVLSAEHVFGDVLGNVITIAKKFKVVHEVFDAAVEEECKYTCPEGGRAVRNKYHKPSSNGCGSLGVQIPTGILPMSEMTHCCDDHDICYDTCGQDKEQCDFDFRRCLYRICEQYETTAGQTVVKGCKTTAKMLFSGTLTLGCKSFIDSQKEACYCAAQKKKYTSGGEHSEL